jgi:hypothetical protein
VLEPPPVWYHGGIPGLEVGDFILPPSETGVLTVGEVVKRRGEHLWRLAGYAKDDPSRVSVTRYLVDAEYYAGLWTINPFREGKGDVYRVVPEDRPEHPRPGNDWICPRAAVAEVVARGVTRARGRDLPGGWGDQLARAEFEWQVLASLGPLPARRRVVVSR